MSDDHSKPARPGGLPRRWPLSLPATAGLVAVAALLMVGAAYVMRPYATPTTDARRAGLSIAVYEPPPPVVAPGERMEVMSGAADSFEGVPQRPEPEPTTIGDWLFGAEVEPYEAPSPRPVHVAEVTPPPEARRYRSDGREDCTYSRTRAEAMVCRDAKLGEFDRDMDRAFTRALDRAAEPERVARDQRRWERARETAAIDGPEAVEDIYRQRLDELDF